MAIKKIKENPITFFRKANEARQNTIKKSLKKAQDGIEMMNDDIINKPGSTGGYKSSENKWWLQEGNIPKLNIPKPNIPKPNKKYSLPYEEKVELVKPSESRPWMTPTKEKKGGIIKFKKK